MTFNNVLKKVDKGNCRISMNGQIAVRTSGGYKTFDPETGRLTNCNQFVTNIGDDFFYVAPATKVKKGDIILLSGRPCCVLKVDKNMVTVMNYETGSYMTVAPEHHMFMGNLYFYEKIFSPMKDMFGKGKMNRMVKMMMLSDMMGQNGDHKENGSAPGFMQMMMMTSMMKNMDGVFDGMFEGLDNEDEANAFDAEEDNLFLNLFDEM